MDEQVGSQVYEVYREWTDTPPDGEVTKEKIQEYYDSDTLKDREASEVRNVFAATLNSIEHARDDRDKTLENKFLALLPQRAKEEIEILLIEGHLDKAKKTLLRTREELADQVKELTMSSKQSSLTELRKIVEQLNEMHNLIDVREKFALLDAKDFSFQLYLGYNLNDNNDRVSVIRRAKALLKEAPNLELKEVISQAWRERLEATNDKLSTFPIYDELTKTYRDATHEELLKLLAQK